MGEGPDYVKSIYELKLHETLYPTIESSISIMRVPGGWLYYRIDSMQISSVFVPFNKEFKGK